MFPEELRLLGGLGLLGRGFVVENSSAGLLNLGEVEGAPGPFLGEAVRLGDRGLFGRGLSCVNASCRWGEPRLGERVRLLLLAPLLSLSRLQA